ncbi:MAG: type II toxin-antitoxin system RelE/ParE family toxin [Alphaproteobacteria bacterium]|nr:type II toxin-antitoxin system RelE/ParE family toxin [Alphaproteobacteria bacterium]
MRERTANYRLGRRAQADLERTAIYGIENFGIEQARIYRDGLKARLEMIARSPLRYPKVDHIRQGYRRCVFEVHSIYYRIEGDTAQIIRILGREDPDLNLPS